MLSVRRGVAAVAVVALLTLPACGSEDQPLVGTGPTTEPTDPNALYADFASCEPLPGPTGLEEPIPGLVELEGAWIEQVTETGPLVSVRGLVGMTPVDLRDAFAERDDVELIYIEDEGYETEILVDSGGHRTFIKATIRCRTGSVFAQIIGPSGEADLLPVPGGAN